MEAKDYDYALHDLEKRLDRLRALYEQYFRGYERAEPLVPRKDVERRLHALRKEMPRNTALRFRFQQLSQRMVMLTTRWGRLTRQIEEGTHPLVLERLKRRRRTGVERKEFVDDEPRDSQPPSYELSLDDATNLDELLSEEEMNKVADAVHRPGPHRGAVPPGPAAQAGRGLGAMESQDDEDTAATGRHQPIQLPDEAGGASHATPVARIPRPAPATAGQTASRSFAKPVNRDAGEARPAPSTAQRAFARPPALGNAGGSAPRPAPTTPRVSGPRATPTSLDESRKRAIYDEFVRARRANNESANVRYEAVAKRIDSMLPELRKKHGAAAIDFDVVVRNGRVGLRPRRG